MRIRRLPEGIYFDADECQVVCQAGAGTLLQTKAGEFIHLDGDNSRRFTPLQACDYLLNAQQPLDEFPPSLLPLRQAMMVREPLPPLRPPSELGIPRPSEPNASTIWHVTISRWMNAIGWSEEEQSNRLLELHALRHQVEAALRQPA